MRLSKAFCDWFADELEDEEDALWDAMVDDAGFGNRDKSTEAINACGYAWKDSANYADWFKRAAMAYYRRFGETAPRPRLLATYYAQAKTTIKHYNEELRRRKAAIGLQPHEPVREAISAGLLEIPPHEILLCSDCEPLAVCRQPSKRWDVIPFAESIYASLAFRPAMLEVAV
jgi:hypothetical protein